jgi:hypothetical protein
VPVTSERCEPGPDRQHVVPGEFGKVGVGEGGIVPRTVRCHAIVQGAIEIVVALQRFSVISDHSVIRYDRKAP